MRVLVAEDDLTSRRMLTAVLKKNGYEVVETADGAEAWEALQKPDAPKLAVLDWMMPVMDGLEVTRRIRGLESETDQPTYILILTIKGEKDDIVAGMSAGANDYLAKPFDTGELKARVEVGRRMVEIQERLAAQVKELRRSLERIKVLEGILPICSFCKKIRDDQGHWNQVEVYVGAHSGAQFSHGICPECRDKHYPELLGDG